ncbi:hypothetical protein F01_460085 [Burkholderia cenocepacia]|nr:hypothetical protein F01_460085 [Burkholderia cenocepacia]
MRRRPMLARRSRAHAVRSDDRETPLSPRASGYSEQMMPAPAGAPTLPFVDRRYSSVSCGRPARPRFVQQTWRRTQ